LLEIHDSALQWDLQKKSIKSKSLRKTLTNGNEESLTDYFNKFLNKLESEGKFGTKDRYATVLNKLHNFIGKEQILFKDFDFEFLGKYEAHLRDELDNSQNTIHSNLRVFRKIINDAIREDLIPYEYNPFPKYQMTTEKTKREYLLDDDLNKIKELDLSKAPRMEQCRNLFLFASNTAGIRVSDLLLLKWNNFDGTYIKFVSQKTQDQTVVKVPTASLPILKYFKKLTGTSKDNFIFPFLHQGLEGRDLHYAIKKATSLYNNNLKDIAKKADIDKNVSSHVARHSWATRALLKGVSLDKVSSLLKHKSLSTTQIYAKIQSTELDKAMDLFND
jgi:site-specific recombinase XerD